MNPNRPIGIFDSGVGGLTVAHAISKSLPNEKIIYFGDTQHLPYGNKSPNKIIYYAEKITHFLLTKGCKAIVIACNSASSTALKQLTDQTDKKCILINVIDPLINAIIDNPSIKRIGVIGTRATISANTYEKKIKAKRQDISVSSLATPLLASLIEEDADESYQQKVVDAYLSNEKLKNIDALILGCTHYPLITQLILNYYNNKIILFNVSKYIGPLMKEKLKKENLLIENGKINKHDFYVSDYTTNFQEKTKLFFPSAIILKEENIFS